LYLVTDFVTGMFDTINFWLSKDSLKSCCMRDIAGRLSKVKEAFDVDTGTAKITGSLSNYHATINDNGLFLAGSLSKLYFGENQSSLSRSTTKDALNMLADALSIPLELADITRIDVACNLPMQHDVPAYYPSLGDARHYRRLEQNNGIYYSNHQKQMLFYGKLHEQQIKQVPVLPIFQQRNVLRYELRFMNRVKNQFNLSELKPDKLTDEQFYIDILNRWKDEYFKIYRHKLLTFKPEIMNSTKAFEQQLMAIGLQAIGGEAQAWQMIEQAKQQGMFENKMQAKRLKDKLKDLCNQPACTTQNQLIEELDKKIKEAVRFYR
jgi:hypothetical protein